MELNNSRAPPEGCDDEHKFSLLRFQSRDELVGAAREFYAERGFALAIRGSGKEKYVVLGCDRGGRYRNTHGILPEQRQRAPSSRLINCPFKIKGKKQENGFWMVELKNCSHNHEPSADMSGHPLCRRLSADEMQRVGEMTQSGVPPRKMLSSLRKHNPNLRATSKTIYNAKAKVTNDYLNGRTMIQALFDELGQGGFTYNVKHDANNCITHLFIAHPMSIQLSRNFSTTFIMDCTYKTNKYKMPLLDVVGVTGFNTSFYSCFVFLQKERVEDYIWALENFKSMLGEATQPSVIATDRELALMNAIKIVFPAAHNLLCVWHISTNLVGKCKKYFEEKDDWERFLSHWKNVVYCSTEDEYEYNWNEFQLIYKEKQNALNYIKEVWLPWKEMFVGAWTEKYMHFGNRTTSRAEGAHSTLKKYLEVSTGNLREVTNKICLVIEKEFNQAKVQLASEKIRIPLNCNISVFKNLIYRVSKFALNEIYKQYQKTKSGTISPICTGNFTTTMGLPCAHQMKNWRNVVLHLEQVHTQWRIDTRGLSLSNMQNDYADGMVKLLDDFQKKYQEWPLHKQEQAREQIVELLDQSEVMFEPTIQRHKGRTSISKKRKAASSTRRDPSQFEIAEAMAAKNSTNINGENLDIPDLNIGFESSDVPSNLWN